MVTQPRIKQPQGAGNWLPEYTRDIERAIVQTVGQVTTSVDAFIIDGGSSTTSLGTSGYLVIDFGGAS